MKHIHSQAVPAFLLISVSLLGGCADKSHYEVLLPRKGELSSAEQSNAAVTPVPVPALPASPALKAQLQALVEQAQKGQSAFEISQRQLAGQIAAAKGSAVLSESWIAGQQAISVVEAARSPTTAARATLDSLLAQATVTNGAGQAEIAEAQELVAHMADGQSRTLASLNSSLSRIETQSH